MAGEVCRAEVMGTNGPINQTTVSTTSDSVEPGYKPSFVFPYSHSNYPRSYKPGSRHERH